MTSLIELMQQNAVAQQVQQAAQQQQHADMMNSLINHQAAQTAHAQNVAAAAAAAPGLGPRRNDGERLVAKFFQCQQFSGKPEHWSDFAFRFKRAARSQNNEVYKMLIDAEVAEDTYDGIDDSENPELSGTLYDILCQHVEGEGFLVLKSMSAACNGF